MDERLHSGSASASGAAHPPPPATSARMGPGNIRSLILEKEKELHDINEYRIRTLEALLRDKVRLLICVCVYNSSTMSLCKVELVLMDPYLLTYAGVRCERIQAKVHQAPGGLQVQPQGAFNI